MVLVFLFSTTFPSLLKPKSSPQLKKISYICRVIENILDNLLPDILYLGASLSSRRELVLKEFEKYGISSIKDFVIDGLLVNEVCYISQLNQVVHANDNSEIVEKAILKIDLVGFKDGVFGYAARSYIIEATQEMFDIVEPARQSFNNVLNFVKTAHYFYKIPGLICETIKKNKWLVSERLGGHGIGEKLHEFPFIPNYFDKAMKKKGSAYDFILEEAMVFAVEPVVFSKHINFSKKAML